MPGLLDVAVTVRNSGSLAAPEVIPLRLTVWVGASSLMVTLPMAFNVGASLTGATVTMNVWRTMLLLGCPSFTVTVTIAVPKAFVAGVNRRLPVLAGLA